MDLAEALEATGMAEASNEDYSYFAVVRTDEGEDGDKINLSVRKELLPPFYCQDFDTLAEVLAELETFPQDFTDWAPVKGEE